MLAGLVLFFKQETRIDMSVILSLSLGYVMRYTKTNTKTNYMYIISAKPPVTTTSTMGKTTKFRGYHFKGIYVPTINTLRRRDAQKQTAYTS